jgi:hypothetical protein
VEPGVRNSPHRERGAHHPAHGLRGQSTQRHIEGHQCRPGPPPGDLGQAPAYDAAMDAHDGQVAASAQCDDATDTSDPNDGPEDAGRAGTQSTYLRVSLDGWGRYSGCTMPCARVAALGAIVTCVHPRYSQIEPDWTPPRATTVAQATVSEYTLRATAG